MILRSSELESDSTSGGSDPTSLADATLIGLSRDGDVAAFAELFQRHHAVAVRIAARTTRSLDAEDVAAEAFARVWRALVDGKGPDRAFRPYLATVVRNIALNGARVRELPTDPALFGDAGAEDTTTVAIAEADAVCTAFASLPDRWRHALWSTVVEERPVSELARSLGTSTNAASALCLRAREGLRAAWLQAHVDRRSTDPECRWVLEHLGAHTRHRLPSRQEARVEAHLDECRHCGSTAARLVVIGDTLKVAAVFAGGGASLVAAKVALGVTSGAAATTGTVLSFPPIAAHAAPLSMSGFRGALPVLRAWTGRLVAGVPKFAAVGLGVAAVVASVAGYALAQARPEPLPEPLAVVSIPMTTTPGPVRTAQPTPEPPKATQRPTKKTKLATGPRTASTPTRVAPRKESPAPRSAPTRPVKPKPSPGGPFRGRHPHLFPIPVDPSRPDETGRR